MNICWISNSFSILFFRSRKGGIL